MEKTNFCIFLFLVFLASLCNSNDYNYDDYNYDFEVIFKDGTKRVYSPEVYLGICKPKTDCIFKIKLNRKDVKNIIQAH